MQVKTGLIIKLPGDLQLKILPAAQLLSCRGIYHHSPLLFLIALPVYLEIRKLTKLPKNWLGQSQSTPFLTSTSGQVQHLLKRWNEVLDSTGGTAINHQKYLFFPKSSRCHSPSAQERFSMHFWCLLTLSALGKLHSWSFTSQKMFAWKNKAEQSCTSPTVTRFQEP